MAPPDLPSLEVRRPGTGTVLGRVPILEGDQVRAAVEGVRRVQQGWGALSPQDRARRLGGLQDTLARRADEVAEVIEAETGKPTPEAMSEVVVCLDLIRYYRRHAPRILRDRRVSTGILLWKRASVRQEPHGVVGVISPWNYPLILALDATVTALFAGNGVVLKPSELTPYTGLIVEDLCADAGLPEGLVRVVTGDGATGAALVESGVDRIHFTGSPETGRQVMALAAQHLVPVALELGGKDPALVLEDADLDRAARGIVFGAFYNAGQTCVSTERVYAVETVYEGLVRRVGDLTRELRLGVQGVREVGPMTDPRQTEIVERQIRDAVADGAKVIIGGPRSDPDAPFLEPTVIIDVRDEMRVMREETFGPVLPIARVRDEDEAVLRANAQDFGLFASVWTGDRARGRRVARRLRAGGVSINDTLSHYAVPGLPMGGVGESGFGRIRGAEGLLQMSRTRSILEDRLGLRRDPWWYPYGAGAGRINRAVLALHAGRGLGRFWAAAKAYLGRGNRGPEGESHGSS